MSQVEIVNTDTAPLKKAVGAKQQGESIFELSRQGRRATAQRVDDTQSECLADIPKRAASSWRTGVARGIRTAGRASFYESLSSELRHRHHVLPVGLLHHEIQPAGCP